MIWCLGIGTLSLNSVYSQGPECARAYSVLRCVYNIWCGIGRCYKRCALSHTFFVEHGFNVNENNSKSSCYGALLKVGKRRNDVHDKAWTDGRLRT
jgi:hypothetical protein